MIGEESKDEGIESLAASEEGEDGKGIMEGSVLEGGACAMESPTSGAVEQRSEKDALSDGISIVKAGTKSNIEALSYEAIENLLDGNSELSQSVSFDTIEERREGSVEGESERDSFPSSLSSASSSTLLD